MEYESSPLDKLRSAYRPQVPAVLADPLDRVAFREAEPTVAIADQAEIRARFPITFGRPLLELTPEGGPVKRSPLKVGVVLSGGQAPGGHNVVTGLYDALQSVHTGSSVVGFLGGPRGIFEGSFRELDSEALATFRNSGGFDLIGSGRDKIESAEQLAASRATCERLGLDGLVVVGGDDSNTNAAVLAEYLLEQGSDVRVAGVPKTIDGDLKGEHVEASFGFDTATRVYSETIGNICRDARSAAKYWHFVKLMGRSASHVTLECALQTRVNIALIGEEIVERRQTLDQVVDGIVDVVARRAAEGRGYGVCLIPEGLVEFVPEMRELIDALNRILAERAGEVDALGTVEEKQDLVAAALAESGRSVFRGLPPAIRSQLLLDRDSHGNVQVSKIDTEQLMIELVTHRVEQRRAAGRFSGKFQVQGHFFGYEGRCAHPSNFDANYTYALGRIAALLVALGRTGYICSVRNLAATPDAWRPCAVPLTSMMRLETRKGREVPVIAKALVRTDGRPFEAFAAERERWAVEDAYRYPGAIQYFGPAEVSSQPTRTLTLESGTRG